MRMALRSVILVEGDSDRAALESLAGRTGHDLVAEGVAVLPMGGATNIGRFLDRYGPRGADVGLAGLCDAREERDFARALERAGFGSDLAREDLERLGFFVCVEDLEDELIRAVGAERLVAIIGEQGEMGRFRRMQRQPAQRDRSLHAHLRVFLGNRKVRYGRLLVESLDLDRAPPPLEALLSRL